MGKLIIPKPNAREKAAFEMADLSEHNVLHLSTCRNNEPRSTPVEYFNNDLTVYMLCKAGGKIANVKAIQESPTAYQTPTILPKTFSAPQECRSGGMP